MARARKSASTGFGALRGEGGLIAPAKLDEIASLEAGEQAAGDYAVPRGLGIKDETARFFRIGQALHKDFASASTPTLQATTRFVEALLRDVLGFDDLVAAGVRTIDERTFPIGVTVIDPACGSGHFLLAAARRIATRVARARAGGVASAADIGVSPSTLDKLVVDGRMPRPKEIGARRVYDRVEMDSAFDAIGDATNTQTSEWDE